MKGLIPTSSKKTSKKEGFLEQRGFTYVSLMNHKYQISRKLPKSQISLKEAFSILYCILLGLQRDSYNNT